MADTDSITLGGGCFWCVEAVYRRISGVVEAVSGYAGGHLVNPDYQSICTGTTGHAEVVKVTYDTGKLSLDDVLDVFWLAHDPTTLNRQGADTGTQYRSTIMVSSDEQEAVAKKSLESHQKDFADPIVTEIVSLGVFYAAEEYHQDYYNLNASAPYCRAVIWPKLDKLKLLS